MQLDPVPNIGSQIERAMIAWFFECYGGGLQFSQFYFSNDWRKRVPPLIEVFAHKSAESVKHSRAESYQVTVDAEWTGTVQPGEPNPDMNWKQINDLIGVAMAAMSLTDDGGASYRAAALKISVAGRRLAVFGTAAISATASDITNNADMVDFYCDFVEFKGSQRLGAKDGTLFLMEKRFFEVRACNLKDDSVFPALTFDGAHTLNWTFTAGAYPEPAVWVLEKSADGMGWLVAEKLGPTIRTADITGTGTQYWRVRRSDDGNELLDPESNIVQATGA